MKAEDLITAREFLVTELKMPRRVVDVMTDEEVMNIELEINVEDIATEETKKKKKKKKKSKKTTLRKAKKFVRKHAKPLAVGAALLVTGAYSIYNSREESVEVLDEHGTVIARK